LVVENFYRPFCHTSEDWQTIWKWHLIYSTLIVTVPFLVAAKLKSLIPLGTWIFFVFGLEDTLFYTLQGRLPSQYPGVAILGIWEPFLTQVLPINIIGLALILAYTIGIGKVPRITKGLIDSNIKKYTTNMTAPEQQNGVTQTTNFVGKSPYGDAEASDGG
jgi:hypothetical protein